jgi:hypothetical protein
MGKDGEPRKGRHGISVGKNSNSERLYRRALVLSEFVTL